MDFQSLRDVENLKKLATEVKKESVSVWNDFGTEVKKLKKADKNSLKEAFNKYFVEYLKTEYINFDGTVSRYSFWMFTLFALLIGFALSIFHLVYVYFLAILLPCIGIIFRRLRDVNLSIWWIALAIIPYVGILLLGCLLALPGKKKK